MGTLIYSILGGSWVVIHGAISRVTILLTHIRGLITPLITTREPPSINYIYMGNAKDLYIISPIIDCYCVLGKWGYK